MSNFNFWQRWLLIVCGAMSIFGISMALLSPTPAFDIFNQQIDPVFWGATLLSASAVQFRNWIYGVWGATIAGWGVMLALIVNHGLVRREKWAWNAIALGVTLWFVLDTWLSWNYQVYFNVIFNIGIFFLAMLPLGFTRKYLDKS